MILPEDLPRAIAMLSRQMADDARRGTFRRRQGKISEADPEKGLYRVRFREQEGETPAFDSPWLKVKAQSTGGYKAQAEPTIGQPAVVVSESGELTDAVIELSIFNDENPRPHSKNGEFCETVGSFKRVLDAGGSETSSAAGRSFTTEGDVTFETGGKVIFK